QVLALGRKRFRIVEGAMDAATWDWIGHLIARWRAEADVSRAPDLRALTEATRSISESGIPEGLVAYVVLGCEWLVRARLVKDSDVEEVVRRLQEGFATPLRDPHLAYLVTEALRLKIAPLVKREGRVSVPFGLYLPLESRLLAGLFRANDDAADQDLRPRPKRIAPSRR